VNHEHDNGKGGISGTSAGVLTTVGGGVQFSVEPRFVVGAEPAFEVTAVPGSGSTAPALRVRLFLGWRS
jgi:hypothetical protein